MIRYQNRLLNDVVVKVHMIVGRNRMGFLFFPSFFCHVVRMIIWSVCICQNGCKVFQENFGEGL